MLFVTGDPNLVGYTRDLVRDPSSAPRATFTTQQVKDFINNAYLALRDLARFGGQGTALKIAYDAPVAGQVEYSKPVDFVKLVSCELELAGLNLSTTAPSAANIRILTPADFTAAWQDYQVDRTTEPEFVSIRDDKIAVIAPPAAAAVGTNALRFVYEASTALLSADGDEPVMARPFHDVICLKAASLLLMTLGQTNRALMLMAAQREQEFKETVAEELWDPDGQAVVAGLDDQQDWEQNTGFMDWG